MATTSSYKRYANGGFSHDNKVRVDNSSVAGTKAQIDLQNEPGRHYGYIQDKVRIPVTNRGTTGTFALLYGHSHRVKGTGTITINILAYGSVSFSGGTDDKWSWKNTFEIGQTK